MPPPRASYLDCDGALKHGCRFVAASFRPAHGSAGSARSGGGIDLQLALPGTPPLGAGTSAVVYPVAYYGVPAAAKVVHAGPASADTAFALAWADNELRVHPPLRHGGVVSLWDYTHVPADGRHMLVMERAEGGSVGELLATAAAAGRPVAAAAVLDVAVQVSDALAYLHDRARVVHGDIKPANILLFSPSRPAVDVTARSVGLQPGTVVKVGDFGLATSRDGNAGPTIPGCTPQFLAPEGAVDAVGGDGTGAARSPARDVYAFGVVLFLLVVCPAVREGGWGGGCRASVAGPSSHRSAGGVTAAQLAALAPVWPPVARSVAGTPADRTALEAVERIARAALAPRPADRPTARQLRGWFACHRARHALASRPTGVGGAAVGAAAGGGVADVEATAAVRESVVQAVWEAAAAAYGSSSGRRAEDVAVCVDAGLAGALQLRPIPMGATPPPVAGAGRPVWLGRRPPHVARTPPASAAAVGAATPSEAPSPPAPQPASSSSMGGVAGGAAAPRAAVGLPTSLAGRVTAVAPAAELEDDDGDADDAPGADQEETNRGGRVAARAVAGARSALRAVRSAAAATRVGHGAVLLRLSQRRADCGRGREPPSVRTPWGAAEAATAGSRSAAAEESLAGSRSVSAADTLPSAPAAVPAAAPPANLAGALERRPAPAESSTDAAERLAAVAERMAAAAERTATATERMAAAKRAAASPPLPPQWGRLGPYRREAVDGRGVPQSPVASFRAAGASAVDVVSKGGGGGSSGGCSGRPPTPLGAPLFSGLEATALPAALSFVSDVVVGEASGGSSAWGGAGPATDAAGTDEEAGSGGGGRDRSDPAWSGWPSGEDG
ncbi:hypothetical protein I4F81_002142 [Pyropia yezoensis]|uniref:Uncharacterized protein n=1 Tax=Pyropia yezoensis TaxID=2788 RepID=A0ACC3BNQ8_PYRYE|nr:hypothetical protein I4F81_002142 [Neopyropia yezoensis]